MLRMQKHRAYKSQGGIHTVSLKRDLAKEIRALEDEIEQLEIRRTRSEAAIIDALIDKKEPHEDDLKYFRTFTADIEAKRERLISITKQLEKLI